MVGGGGGGEGGSRSERGGGWRGMLFSPTLIRQVVCCGMKGKVVSVGRVGAVHEMVCVLLGAICKLGRGGS